MKLSDFELDVMQIIWDEGSCSAAHIHKLINQNKKSAYTTVKTIVDRLEEKDAILRVGQEGRAIIYQAKVSRKSMTPSVLPGFLKRFFGGSSRNLITHLIEDENLSESDLEYLTQYIQDKKNNSKK